MQLPHTASHLHGQIVQIDANVEAPEASKKAKDQHDQRRTEMMVIASKFEMMLLNITKPNICVVYGRHSGFKCGTQL